MTEVAERVIRELQGENTSVDNCGEPFRRLLHGGPGTGKTHVVKLLRELFEEQLHWEMGVQFQVVAFQAAMAQLIGGDTIHHACGIPVFTKGDEVDQAAASQQTVAKRALQWRWLLIDEVSMVSARLLAQLDVKLRSVIRDLASQKRGSGNVTRPFGGLNVLCCGDFWQLDPPDGGFLADIPVEYIQRGRKYAPAPTVSHGQSLFWAGAEFGMQGVTELVELERCKDKWLHELQEEIRYGRLSADNWNFLHGRPTNVPGSWACGAAQCGNDACQALAELWAATSAQSDVGITAPRKRLRRLIDFAEQECEQCKKERCSKARVALCTGDERFTSAPFDTATAVFPNNDVKYDTNKTRGRLFAARQNTGIVYSVAKDTPSQDALRERPGLAADKVKWLQRHDRESGDLYGMLPLILRMPVALTDHIDRSPEKQLLRGRVGFIHSWVLDEKEQSVMEDGVQRLTKLPKVVFVKFPDATWTLPGLDEPGLYPIQPKPGKWFLDKGRKHPVLKITRRQLPLAPAFAITAHAAQGQTLKAAIVDLQIGRGTSPIASYVALTRVARREDLLIFRPFARELFTQGPPEGPELLLQTLRGEHVDWTAIEKKHTPSRLCAGCAFIRWKDEFALSQWNRKDEKHVCKECMSKKAAAGTPVECMGACGLWKAATAFTEENLRKTARRVCKDCAQHERRQCKACGECKEQSEFTEFEWSFTSWRNQRGKCRTCMRRCEGQWTCTQCKHRKNTADFSMWSRTVQNARWQQTTRCNDCMGLRKEGWKCLRCQEKKPVAEFTAWLQGRTIKKNNGKAWCNACRSVTEAEEKNVARDAYAQVQRKPNT